MRMIALAAAALMMTGAASAQTAQTPPTAMAKGAPAKPAPAMAKPGSAMVKPMTAKPMASNSMPSKPMASKSMMGKSMAAKPGAKATTGRTAASIACSGQADAQNLHGKPRAHFMTTCKRKG